MRPSASDDGLLTNILSDPNPPYILLLQATPADVMCLDDARDSGGKPVVVRFLDGGRMRTDEGIFDQYAAALQFPWYFGRNWNAWRDCMADPYWSASMRYGDAYLVIIYRADELLADDPRRDEGLGHFLRACVNASEALAHETTWSSDYLEPPHALHTLLQLETMNQRNHVQSLCEEVNVAVRLLNRAVIPLPDRATAPPHATS